MAALSPISVGTEMGPPEGPEVRFSGIPTQKEEAPRRVLPPAFLFFPSLILYHMISKSGILVHFFSTFIPLLFHYFSTYFPLFFHSHGFYFSQPNIATVK